MRYLLILDLTLAALGAAMTIGVGFVALVYLVYGHTYARMQAGLSGVSIMTGCFFTLFLLALLAGLLLKRRNRWSWPWHWPAQVLLFGALPLLWQTVLVHLRTP